MKLDIHSAVVTALLLTSAGIILSFLIGVQSIRSGSHLPFFRKKRDRILRGWRFILTAAVLGAFAFIINRYAEPSIYHYFPPTPTVTDTPTITLTYTISPTLTITLTPTITETPSITDTPSLPQSVLQDFQVTVVPNPEAVFSPIQFAKAVDKDNRPVNPAKIFTNPVGHLYGTFSFDKMKNGSEWSALWYRGSDLVYFETSAWKGGTGGFGYTDWNPAAEAWMPGDYQVRIFVGTDWKLTGYFTVNGNPPSPTPTPSPTNLPPPTVTPYPTLTASPTRTPWPTITITYTPSLTRTYPPTATYTPTRTTWPSQTPLPTWTPRPRPTSTPNPTASPAVP